MTMAYEARTDYRVLAQGVQVFYRCERATATEQRYLLGLAEDISLGGVFVAAQYPPRPGTVVRLHLYAGNDNEYLAPLTAKAVVRWRRPWGKERGMGIQFLELDGLGERRLESWMDGLLEADMQSGARPSTPLPTAVA
jgi:c-di-GMP-binding flagellar brake protein YcgR